MVSLQQRIWKGWIRFAEIIGTIQMTILLSIVYWILMPFVAIPFRFLSDPLALKAPNRSHWVKREPISDMFEAMKNQF